MESKNNLVLLVAVFALATLFVSSAGATHENLQGLVKNFATITNVEVNGIEETGALTGTVVNIGAFAGETLPVRITFNAVDNASDVRLKVWISGEKENIVSSERFDVIKGSTYSRLVSVPVPFDIDPEEEMRLYITIESRDGGLPTADIVRIKAQRESYLVEILDADMPADVKAGDNLAVNVVLKNRGRQFAEDTFVRAKIPALGIEAKSYFGDLSPVDQNDPDKEDSAERRVTLNIPRSAKAGVYVVELEAYNGDSITTLSKKVSIVGASGESSVVSKTASKTFGVNEKEKFSITLVNTGDKVRIYELVGESSSEDLDISVDDSVIVIPAGESKTVDVTAKALKAGKYTFAVNVISDGDLVKKEVFTATVEGDGKVSAGNTTVLLTVILAIVFVVLLVVLIVLLTRKPEKKEFGESYY